MKTYAQLNDNNIVVGVSNLSNTVEASNMIELTSDFDVMGKQWDGKLFIDVVQVVPTFVRTEAMTLDQIHYMLTEFMYNSAQK